MYAFLTLTIHVFHNNIVIPTDWVMVAHFYLRGRLYYDSALSIPSLSKDCSPIRQDRYQVQDRLLNVLSETKPGNHQTNNFLVQKEKLIILGPIHIESRTSQSAVEHVRHQTNKTINEFEYYVFIWYLCVGGQIYVCVWIGEFLQLITENTDMWPPALGSQGRQDLYYFTAQYRHQVPSHLLWFSRTFV